MIPPITPPHIDAQSIDGRLSQLRSYLGTLANQLNLIASELDSHISRVEHEIDGLRLNKEQ